MGHTEAEISEVIAAFTVRISTARDAAGPWTGTGTGFFFNFEVDDQNVLAVITNKHVIEGAQKIGLQMHVRDSDRGLPGPGRQLEIQGGEMVTVAHPDPVVDIAAILLQPALTRAAERDGWHSFIGVAAPINIPTAEQFAEFMPIESVLMVGYPNGIYDAANNTAVSRRGITASPLRNRYEGRDEFLIDMAVFPGSSGSPVMIADEGSYSTKSGLILGSRFHLLGVLFAGYHSTVDGEIVLSPAPTALVPIPRMHQMIHLGACVRSTKILDLLPLLPLPRVFSLT